MTDDAFSVQILLSEGATASQISELRVALQNAGLELGPTIAGSFSIAGKRKTIERVLEDRGGKLGAMLDGSLDRLAGKDLPASWRDAVACVLISRAPDFGPGNP